MPRSTDTQKAERLNAAHGLLARGTSTAEAATLLSREFGFSRRPAYSLGEAETIGHAVPVGEPTVTITLKIPGDVVRNLRAYSAASGVTIGEIVARAIFAFLAAQSRHG